MENRRAVAIVPAYNEVERLDRTVAALWAIPEIRNVLVVDDGSADDTAALALRAGAECISLGRNRGKGAALNAGIATTRGYVVSGRWQAPAALLLADADLGSSAQMLVRLLKPVLGGDADLAIADLPPQPRAGGFGVVKRLARRGLKAKGAGDIREPLSGQRAVAWEALPAITPFAPGFGVEVQMTIDALAAGLRIVEITLPLTHAATGKGFAGALHRAAQAAAVARVLMRTTVSVRMPKLEVRRWVVRVARDTASNRRPPT
jgi:hypothetical protein